MRCDSCNSRVTAKLTAAPMAAFSAVFILDVLFINVSEHYKKGKRQNTLGDGNDGEPENDILKIVETYQFRQEEERYSRKVSTEEIEKNRYNLNISRYVPYSFPYPQTIAPSG